MANQLRPELRGDDEIPSRMQALKMYTSGSAWLAHDETK
jgi:predicted amidohydrolase YtcJ